VDDVANEIVEKRTPAVVEGCIRFVEQPDLGAAQQQPGETETPALSGAQLLGDGIDTMTETNTSYDGLNILGRAFQGLGGELEILAHTQIGVKRSFVPEPPDLATKLTEVALDEVNARDLSATCAQGHQTGEQTKQTRLSRAIRTGHHAQRRGLDLEINAAQQRKATRQHDGVVKTYDAFSLCRQAGLTLESVDIRGDHHLDESVEINVTLPPEQVVRFGGVADQQVDFCWPNKRLVNNHVVLIFETGGTERDLAQFAY
jgi:hypothetical protein